MPSSNLGSQVTGTTPCWPCCLFPSKCLIRPSVHESSEEWLTGMQAPTREKVPGASLDPSLSPHWTSVLFPLQKPLNQWTTYLLSNFKIRRLLEHVSIWSNTIVITDARVSTAARGSKARDAQCSMRYLLSRASFNLEPYWICPSAINFV
jgi:hypothetical protein